jgi:hypothetical protein
LRILKLETALALAFIALALSTSTVHAVVMVGRNIDIAGEASSDRQRVEPTIAVDPRNPNIIVSGAQDLRLFPQGHRWHGYYRSIDGGLTWSSSLVPGFPGDTSPQGKSSALHTFDLTTDPVLAFDLSGNVYYAGIAIKLSGAGFFTASVVFVAKYVNDGADFAFVTLDKDGFDKPWIAVDTSGGVNTGNVYLGFDGSTSTSVNVGLFARSTDGGNTFSQAILLPSAGSGDLVLPEPTIDPAGHVFVSSLERVHNGTTFTFPDIQVSKSTDGGVTFKTVIAASGITILGSASSFLAGNRFRVFTVPQIASDNNGVFVVWDDLRTGDANILLTRSTDGGVTWSTPVVVNDVTTNQQFFPSIASSGGSISVIWYDSRLGQLPNGTITGLDVFYAQSTNAGASFSKSVRVTSVSFNPNLVERTDLGSTGIFIGDYIQVAASAGVVHPVWTDNRNACDTIDPTFGCVDQDTFTATITTTS